MEDKPASIFERIFDEFKSGNPLFYIMTLFVVVLLVTAWVWQTVTTPVIIATPRFSHPTAAYILTLTAQARQGGNLIPAPRDGTPEASFFDQDRLDLDWDS